LSDCVEALKADNSTSLLRPLANLAFGHQEATLAAENQWSDGGRAGMSQLTTVLCGNIQG